MKQSHIITWVINLRKSWIYIYFVGIIFTLVLICISQKAVSTVLSSNVILRDNTVILDAGHGGPDGGAVSCTGVPESRINLEITLKLRDLFQLMGYKTVMIRETDTSVYTSGDTIAQKKVSDLKERVRIANTTKNGFLISIHQNTFSQEQYYGAQVFYAHTPESRHIAEAVQNSLINNLAPDSNRKCKQGNGIYLLEQIHIPGVLIECGFLSNRKEEALLRNQEYQKQLSAAICSVVCVFLSNT